MKLKLFLLIIFLASILFSVYFFFLKETPTDRITQSDYTESSTPTMGNVDHREALLIGNNTYKHIDNLEDPSDNIVRLKESLEDLNFNVTVEKNLNSEHLSEAIELFAKRLSENQNNIGFLYYSGHGCQLNYQGYLVPTDVDTKNKVKIKHHALSINEMLDTLEMARNRVNMLFLDSCRDVPTGTRGGKKGLAQLTATPKGSLVVYATEAGKTAEDNSNFINALIDNISKPNQNVKDMADNISNAVADKTDEKQIPVVFYKRLPKTILNQTINVLNTKIKEIVMSPKIEKEEVIVSPTPKVIEKKYSLTIKTDPIDATVKILNIKPKYKDGILLKKGNYKIEVSKKGYERLTTNFYVKNDISKNFTLTKIVIKEEKRQSTVINELPITKASYLGGREKAVQNSYYIKVGTYRDTSAIVSQIKRNNFNYSLVKVENGRTLTRVLIGPFFSRDQANTQLSNVKANILSGAWITKVR